MKYLNIWKRTILAYKPITLNGNPTIDISYISKVPKEKDIAYVKELINIVYNCFEVEQYIQKMIWDKPNIVIPALYFPNCPKDKFDLMHELHNEICEILGNLWNLDKGTPANQIAIYVNKQI